MTKKELIDITDLSENQKKEIRKMILGFRVKNTVFPLSRMFETRDELLDDMVSKSKKIIC